MTNGDASRCFFAYDLREGTVVRDLSEDDIGEYRVRYFPHDAGNWATIGDGLRHDIWFQDYHWDRLLQIIKEDQLDQSGLDLILNGWLASSFPDDASKKRFVAAVKSEQIKPVAAHLPIRN